MAWDGSKGGAGSLNPWGYGKHTKLLLPGCIPYPWAVALHPSLSLPRMVMALLCSQDKRHLDLPFRARREAALSSAGWDICVPGLRHTFLLSFCYCLLWVVCGLCYDSHECRPAQLSMSAAQGAVVPLPGWGVLQEWPKAWVFDVARHHSPPFSGVVAGCQCLFSVSMAVSWFLCALASVKTFNLQWGQGRSHMPLMKSNSYSMIFNGVEMGIPLLTASCKNLQVHFLGL